jgi:hypothetical protein
MENQSISRLHYFERQFLRTQDFQAEQAYHLGMMRRHQVTHHSWGIVRGLELALNPDCNPVLQPGIAVDGYGRTLVWQAGQPLPVTEFEVKGSDRLDVWLVYGELDSDDAPSGYAGCSLDGSGRTYYRTQEQPILMLGIPDPTHPDPRMPPGVPEGDLNFDGTQNAPLSPSAFWPVYLGRVLRKREKPNDPWQYSVSLDGRPYAGLVGEMVRHPTDNAWVEIGTPLASQGNESRFAVYLIPPGQDPQDVSGGLDPRLEVSSGGQITLRGDASLHGNLVMEQGALAFRAQDSQAPAAGDPQPPAVGVQPAAQQNEPGKTPRPWSIYRAPGSVQVTKPATQGQGVQTTSSAATVPTSDLRLEMAGRTGGKNQVVIGAWGKGPDGNEAFQPCLTIDDDCNVTIERNLVVKGFIYYSNGTTPYTLSGAAPLSPEVRNMLVAGSSQAATSMAQGTVTGAQAGAAGQVGLTVDDLARFLLEEDLDQLIRLIRVIADSAVGATKMASAVAASGPQGEALLGAMLDSEDVMILVRNALHAGPEQETRLNLLADRVKEALGIGSGELTSFIDRLNTA